MSDAGRERVHRRWPLLAAAVAVAAAMIGVLIWVDAVARATAEQHAEQQIASSLGDVPLGTIDVHIGGGPFLIQLLGGSLDSVDVSSAQNGGPVSIDANATGVPLDGAGAIDAISGSVTLGEDYANQLLAESSSLPGSLVFADGAMSYQDAFTVLGVGVPYTLALAVDASGHQIVLTPVDVTVAGLVSLSLDQILGRLGIETIDVCVANLMLAAAKLDGIELSQDAVTVLFRAENVPIDDAAQLAVGRCDD